MSRAAESARVHPARLPCASSRLARAKVAAKIACARFSARLMEAGVGWRSICAPIDCGANGPASGLPADCRTASSNCAILSLQGPACAGATLSANEDMRKAAAIRRFITLLTGATRTKNVPQLIAAFLSRHLLQGLIDRETARLLPRRKLLECGQELADDRLGRDQDEDVFNEPSVVTTRLMFCTLEWVGAQVEELGCPQRNKRLHPDLKAVRRLFHEHGLVLVVTQAGEVAVVSPVEELAARIGALAARACRVGRNRRDAP